MKESALANRNRRKQRRSRYARTNGDMTLGGPINPSDSDPATFWWWGDDNFVQQTGGVLAAVTRSQSIITNTIASLPFRLLTGGTDPLQATIELPSPRWATDPHLHRPDARFGDSPISAALRMTRSSFWGTLLRSAIMRGMGYLLFEEDSSGMPVAGTLRVLNPEYVGTVEQPFVHRRIGRPDVGPTIDLDFDGRASIGGRRYRLVELLNPLDMVDEYGCTRGVLEVHAAEHGIALRQTAYADGMYRTGVPAGYLKVSVPNFDKTQAENLKQRWLENHGGDRRSIAVLNATTDFVPISQSPVDMELIASRQMSLVDIANMFGVPVYMLGGTDGGSNTYSNAESRNQDFVRYSLVPWANALDDMLTSLVPQGQFIEVDFKGLLRADTKTRFEAYSVALRDGWLLPDEVRLIENLRPMHEVHIHGPFATDTEVAGGTPPAITTGQEGQQ
jgi:phage portal protein BeeE